MHLKLFIIFAFVLTFTFLSLETARACSCGADPTVLAGYEMSDAVVIAKVESAEVLREQGPYTTFKSTKLKIEKVYKGKIADEITLSLEGPCSFPVTRESIGSRFLAYLYYSADENVWGVHMCSRTRNLSEADNDLLYLNNIDKVRGKTRIAGVLDFFQEPVLEGEKAIRRKLGGLKVKIIGVTQAYEVKTDKNGVYEIYDLPAGNYAVEPEVPPRWKVDASSVGFSIPPVERSKETGNLRFWLSLQEGKHEGYDFRYEFDNSISGTILDLKGRPMQNVCLNLTPANGEPAFGFYEADCTNENGRFVLDGMPPGDYVIVINKNSEITGSEPFNTFFYPGVFEREKATVLKIGEGDKREGFNMRPPKEFETIIVSGIVTYSDGTPVKGERIEFHAGKGSREQSISQVLTNKEGRFSIRLLKGSFGKINSSEGVYDGMYINCPEVQKLIAKSKENYFNVPTNVVEVNGKGDMDNVKLVLPFPFCTLNKDIEK